MNNDRKIRPIPKHLQERIRESTDEMLKQMGLPEDTLEFTEEELKMVADAERSKDPAFAAQVDREREAKYGKKGPSR